MGRLLVREAFLALGVMVLLGGVGWALLPVAAIDADMPWEQTVLLVANILLGLILLLMGIACLVAAGATHAGRFRPVLRRVADLMAIFVLVMAGMALHFKLNMDGSTLSVAILGISAAVLGFVALIIDSPKDPTRRMVGGGLGAVAIVLATVPLFRDNGTATTVLWVGSWLPLPVGLMFSAAMLVAVVTYLAWAASRNTMLARGGGLAAVALLAAALIWKGIVAIDDKIWKLAEAMDGAAAVGMWLIFAAALVGLLAAGLAVAAGALALNWPIGEPSTGRTASHPPGRRLSCPKCGASVYVHQGQRPACTSCGFGAGKAQTA
jgi:ribosomal protein L37E